MKNKDQFNSVNENKVLSKKLAAIDRKLYLTSGLIYLVVGLIFVTIVCLQLL